jgi:hypothetical protein
MSERGGGPVIPRPADGRPEGALTSVLSPGCEPNRVPGAWITGEQGVTYFLPAAFIFLR